MDGNTEDLQKFVPQVHFEQIPIKNLFQILYLICDYPHKHYTFKHFEV